MVHNVTNPYINKAKKELGLPDTHKALLVWVAFTAQSTDKVMRKLERLTFKVVLVPKNMTHLLQPFHCTSQLTHL